MLIEIHGGQFRNKGAEKMLTVTVAELSKRIPNVRFVVDEVFGSKEDLQKRALVSLVPRRGWVSNPRFSGRFSLQRMVGEVLPNLNRFSANHATVVGVDALVDISGFAYTDEWGTVPCRSIGALAEYYGRKAKPVVFLPQALGPFRFADNRANFKRAVIAADRIYARDDESLAYVRELFDDPVKIRRAPDITLFSAARLTPAECDMAAPILFVPNIRMLRQGSAIWEEGYTATLIAMIDNALASGFKPQLMVHDQSGQDRKIAEEVSTACRSAIEIVEETDPWRLKQRISDALFVVGSRYHALIAAFSTGVPSIALGWSHKYPALYREFGQERFVVSKPDIVSAKEIFDHLADRAVNINCRQSICGTLARLSVINGAMWDDAVSVLIGEAQRAGKRASA